MRSLQHGPLYPTSVKRTLYEIPRSHVSTIPEALEVLRHVVLGAKHSTSGREIRAPSVFSFICFASSAHGSLSESDGHSYGALSMQRERADGFLYSLLSFFFSFRAHTLADMVYVPTLRAYGGQQQKQIRNLVRAVFGWCEKTGFGQLPKRASVT